MRKQYHSRPVGGDIHVRDVHRLIRAAQGLPVRDVPLDEIAEIDEDWWRSERAQMPTPRRLADHMVLVREADAAHPIPLCSEGRLMDGMHRVVGALVEGRTHIAARRFGRTPPPDHVNVSLEDLPYPDEEIRRAACAGGL